MSIIETLNDDFVSGQYWAFLKRSHLEGDEDIAYAFARALGDTMKDTLQRSNAIGNAIAVERRFIRIIEPEEALV